MYRILKSDCEHGPFYDTWSYLYERLTTKPLPQVLGANDRAAVRLLPGLDAYVDILYAACGETNRPGIVARGSARTYDLPASKKALVAFSGGKDSVATAIALRKEYDVKLYHLSGINHGYSHERNYCDELASMLGLPLVVRNVHIKVEKGCPFKENPVKNQLIQAAMLEYGLRNGITTYAFGSGGGDPEDLSKINPLYCMSDFAGLFRQATAFFQKYVSAYTCLHPFTMETEAYWTIFQECPEILRRQKHTSCIMPVYRKPMLHAANIRAGVALEKSRCGTCNKCAYEYLHMVLFGLTDYKKEYAAKCVKSICDRVKTDVYDQARRFTENEALGVYIDFALLRREYAAWADFDPAHGSFVKYLERHATGAVRR